MTDSAMPRSRLLQIMGSGETAPTMVKVHRGLVERLAPTERRGVLLDTPYGFQTNAEDLSRRAVEYFRRSVGIEMEPLGLRRREQLEGPRGDSLVAKLARAGIVFSGPGSPTYALRHWRGTPVPSVLEERLRFGGAITFASAAALTLGAFSAPVYEIYKVGEEPRFEAGLDVLSLLGWRVAVIPHFDNAEGGTHDTRYCYLGEERLRLMERTLPDDAFVLGVDEHTALVLDLDAERFEVAGIGGVTVRVAGRCSVFPSGYQGSLDEIAACARALRTRAPSEDDPGRDASERRSAEAPGPEASASGRPDLALGGGRGASPLRALVRAREQGFADALRRRDPEGMASELIALVDDLWAWSTDPTQSDDLDRGKAASKAMIEQLAELARHGARDPAELVAPFVEAVLEARRTARSEGRFDLADRLRARLVELGVEVRDGRDQTTWRLRQPEPA